MCGDDGEEMGAKRTYSDAWNTSIALLLSTDAPLQPQLTAGAHGSRSREEQSTHRELVIRPQHVLLLLARRVPADVAHHKERGGKADGRAHQDAPPKGGVKHLFADHQGQPQEQSICSVDKRYRL